VNVLVFMVVAIAFFPDPAYAYLDVGTASMVLQMALAAIVGALVSIKMYWLRLSQFMRKLFRTNKTND
jgi:hypothetical protein